MKPQWKAFDEIYKIITGCLAGASCSSNTQSDKDACWKALEEIDNGKHGVQCAGQLLLGAEAEGEAEIARRGGPGAPGDLRQARHRPQREEVSFYELQVCADFATNVLTFYVLLTNSWKLHFRNFGNPDNFLNFNI